MRLDTLQPLRLGVSTEINKKNTTDKCEYSGESRRFYKSRNPQNPANRLKTRNKDFPKYKFATSQPPFISLIHINIFFGNPIIKFRKKTLKIPPNFFSDFLNLVQC